MVLDALDEKRKKVVKVLARAATEPEYHDELQKNPKKVLNEAGIEGEEFDVPKDLKTIFCILKCLGDVIEKRY